MVLFVGFVVCCLLMSVYVRNPFNDYPVFINVCESRFYCIMSNGGGTLHVVRHVSE